MECAAKSNSASEVGIIQKLGARVLPLFGCVTAKIICQHCGTLHLHAGQIVLAVLLTIVSTGIFWLFLVAYVAMCKDSRNTAIGAINAMLVGSAKGAAPSKLRTAAPSALGGQQPENEVMPQLTAQSNKVKISDGIPLEQMEETNRSIADQAVTSEQPEAPNPPATAKEAMQPVAAPDVARQDPPKAAQQQVIPIAQQPAKPVAPPPAKKSRGEADAATQNIAYKAEKADTGRETPAADFWRLSDHASVRQKRSSCTHHRRIRNNHQRWPLQQSHAYNGCKSRCFEPLLD
ncbi:MAG: hypothetical protein LBB38_02915 [Puniceicoccales bacterium]|jgi:hypothetical protein|nr:hypothetical protein [Puniceicoccales bacterium]